MEKSLIIFVEAFLLAMLSLSLNKIVGIINILYVSFRFIFLIKNNVKQRKNED